MTNSRTNCTVIIMHLKLLPEQHVHEFIENPLRGWLVENGFTSAPTQYRLYV